MGDKYKNRLTVLQDLKKKNHALRHNQQNKKTTYKKREIFESHVCDKGRILRVYRALAIQ